MRRPEPGSGGGGRSGRAVAALAAALLLGGCAGLFSHSPEGGPAELIVRNALVTTQDGARPQAQALAVRDGVFVAVGDEAEVEDFAGPQTRVIDAGGRRVIPGLNDSHLHAVRGGRFYALELRWDGVDSLERALAMVAEQAARTPARQWVRVVGGWSPLQFRERRMPTVAELNRAAPGTPVFVLHLYSGGLLNAAGVAALHLAPGSLPPAGGRFEFIDGGARLLAEPSPVILYETIAKLPELSAADQLVSTRHFFRELNRFGLTSAVDPGGGGHAWPADYAATKALAAEPAFPLRLSNYLFPQRPGRELLDVGRWTAQERLDLNLALDRLNGLVVEGAGELLVASASDYENFLAPRPELQARMEADLTAVARVLAQSGWPLRIHATYDESITRILDVFEPVFAETGYRARWCIDHAETISDANLARIAALGGGVAVQDRMAFAGEDFAARYGVEAAGRAPPLRALLAAGVPLGAGTDGTRVSSYNPWPAIAWMTTGR
ncbi:MAG TPA: amidohydrolase, partial [Planctomycetota bacterium]|nr:amidohydrolase [Planctomycetota bacterium]